MESPKTYKNYTKLILLFFLKTSKINVGKPKTYKTYKTYIIYITIYIFKITAIDF